MEIRKTAIVGMGALGMLYGTFLLDAGEQVQYVMDGERVKKHSGKTFYKNGKPYQLPVCDCAGAAPADLVMVAVKYGSLSSALETMKNSVGEHTVILSVMNGITSEEILGERYGKERMIYTVAQGMDAMKFGEELTFTQMGELHIGAKEPCQVENLRAVERFFAKTGMPYQVETDILHRLWGKFMLNVGINQTCMVYETNYGGCLKKGEANRTMIAAMREVIALARAEGVTLGEEDLQEYVEILGTLLPEGVPSMRQDALAKRPSEVEMFAGTVIALAKKHGLLVPANEFLYERVREMERSYRENPEPEDIWDELYRRACAVRKERRVSDYVTAGEVAAAVLTASGKIYTGVCVDTCSTLGICAERSAIFQMLTHGEQEIRKVAAVMPDGRCGAPCGACRELMVQLMPEHYREIEILMDYAKRRVTTLGELTPEWWI